MQRKFVEFEDETKIKEKDYNMALEDGRRNERKLHDEVGSCLDLVFLC